MIIAMPVTRVSGCSMSKGVIRGNLFLCDAETNLVNVQRGSNAPVS